MTTNDAPRVSDAEYDPETDAYHAQFDPDEVSANSAVVESTAAVLRRDPLEIDPLYEYIDTDSLDTLVRTAPGKTSPYVSMSFRFEGADVTVRSDGTVIVAPDDGVD